MAEPLEPARLLAAKSEFGYTDRMDRALKDEPEAVSPDEQRRLTRQAAQVQASRAGADWNDRRYRLQAELAALGRQAYTKGHSSELRLLERHLVKLDSIIRRELANLAL